MSWLSAIRDYITGAKTQSSQNIALNAIRIDTNPQNGFVLTSDAKGNGTWAAGSGLSMTKTVVTAAQLNNLAAGNIVLVPAPTNGSINLLINYYASLAYGGATFTGGNGTCQVQYGVGAGDAIGSNSTDNDSNLDQIIKSTSSTYGQQSGTVLNDGTNVLVLPSLVNQPIELTSGLSFGTGNGTLTIYVFYQNFTP
jgi:hypothetical protein